MDLDELRSVQSKERRKDSLQHLRDSFYEDVGSYLAERKRTRDERAASVDQPFSDKEVRKLSNEIETAEEVIESLYQRRVGKVVKLSSFAAAGAPTDTEGMTIQEAELFEDLVVRIEQNKDRVLAVLENGADIDIDVDAEAAAAPEAVTTGAADATGAGDPSGPAGDDPAPPPDTPHEGDGDGVLADAMGGDGGQGAAGAEAEAGPAPDAPAESTSDTTPASTDGPEAVPADEPGEFVPGSEPDRSGEGAEPTAESTASPEPTGGETPDSAGGDGDGTARRTVRVTRDVGRILGVDDIEYDLAAEDVVTLPAENAGPLVERDAAEPVE